MTDPEMTHAEKEQRATTALAQAFTPDQIKALKTIWGLNADTIEAIKRMVRRAVGWIAVIVAGLSISLGALAVVQFVVLRDHHEETAKIAKASVMSRYDASYFSCLNTDNSNRLANPLIVKTLEHPTEQSIRALVNVLRPLRSSNAPPPAPLPKHIPKAWVEGCRDYASQQISLKPPAGVMKPPPPTSTTQSTTASDN